MVNGKNMADHMCHASRIILIGSGSSHNAAVLGKYLIEALARIPCQVSLLLVLALVLMLMIYLCGPCQAQYASEFCTESNPFGRFTSPPVLIAISQSGETGDVAAAVKNAKGERQTERDRDRERERELVCEEENGWIDL